MPITALSDAELIEQARGGDEAAFTELYVRHQPAALRLARTYRRLGDPDELVNGAFERVLGAIKRGSGPTESFRAYLFVTLRRYAAEKSSKPDEESLDDVPEPISEAADSPALAQADRALISEAFESLPDRWQAVLWHTAVEGQQPRELAGVLGVSANAASAMAYRAREKLRQAYLQAHLLASPAPDHEPYRSQLGAYVRGGLSPRDTTAVEKHLEGCESCRALVAELEDVNRSLARAVLPLFLLVGGGKLGGALVGGAAVGAAAENGATSLFGKIKNAAPTVGSAAAIAAVVAGMIAMGSAVARQDSGPLNSAADAADLGVSDDGDGSSSGSGGQSDSLFGDEDFALSPFDDQAGDDFDSEFGDDFGFGDLDDFGDDFRFPRSRATGGIPSSAGTPPGGGTPGPLTPPPATNPPANPPVNPPDEPADQPPGDTPAARVLDPGVGTHRRRPRDVVRDHRRAWRAGRADQHRHSPRRPPRRCASTSPCRRGPERSPRPRRTPVAPRPCRPPAAVSSSAARSINPPRDRPPPSRSTCRSTAPGRRPTWCCSGEPSRRRASRHRSTSHSSSRACRCGTAPHRGPSGKVPPAPCPCPSRRRRPGTFPGPC